MVDPPRLLVVDDEPMVLEFLVACLAEAGYLVDPASGAAEAMRLVDTRRYDAAVVDKNMRGVATDRDGGIEVVRALHDRMPACRVLAISGSPDESELAEMMCAGAHGWLAKPFTADELTERVAEMAGPGESRAAVETGPSAPPAPRCGRGDDALRNCRTCRAG